MISSLTYIQGRQLKQPIKQERFIPDYLGERINMGSDKTLEEQQKEFAAFHGKLKTMTGT